VTVDGRPRGPWESVRVRPARTPCPRRIGSTVEDDGGVRHAYKRAAVSVPASAHRTTDDSRHGRTMTTEGLVVVDSDHR